jgi:hypothetical protein
MAATTTSISDNEWRWTAGPRVLCCGPLFSPVPKLNGYLSLLRPIVRRFYHSASAAIRTRFTRLFSA